MEKHTNLMVDILALLVYGSVNDGVNLSCTGLLNVGCALFVRNGLCGWCTYLFGYIMAHIIVLSTILSCWHKCTHWLVDGFAHGFVCGIIYSMALLNRSWTMNTLV